MKINTVVYNYSLLLFYIEVLLCAVVGWVFGSYDTWGHKLFLYAKRDIQQAKLVLDLCEQVVSFKICKSMGHVLRRALFIMHEKYFLKSSYTNTIIVYFGRPLLCCYKCIKQVWMLNLRYRFRIQKKVSDLLAEHVSK